MKRLICGGLGSALTALVFAAACLQESSQANPGYAQFAASPAPPESGASVTQNKEMIEIRREREIKFLPPDGPNEPIALGNNCYFGTNPKTNSPHEQNQLEELLE